MARIKIEDIQQIISAAQWTLVSTEYKNLDTEMEFQCNEGHKVLAPWKHLRDHLECPICKKNTFNTSCTEVKPKKKGSRRTLGLDQATHTTGWSVFDDKQLVAFGAYHVIGDDEIARDNDCKKWLINMIQMWQPDMIGLEGIQMQENGTTMGVTVFQTLARLQGILMECCYELSIPYEICHTATWRTHSGVKGKTRADKKRSMQMIVKQLYDVTITDDEADAVGIGKYIADNFCTQPKIMSWE